MKKFLHLNHGLESREHGIDGLIEEIYCQLARENFNSETLKLVEIIKAEIKKRLNAARKEWNSTIKTKFPKWNPSKK